MLEILLTIIAFIIVFSILVLVHEFGHFITAKKSGVKVEEFGMGLPPRALTLWKDKAGTIYSLNWIPFGGFVRMLGEDDGDETTKNNPNSFMNQKLWKRMLIVTAGVIMNFALAIVCLSIVFTAGFFPLAIVDDQKIPVDSYIIQRESFAKETGTLVETNEKGILIESVQKDSLAEKAGFQKDDLVLLVNGEKMASAQALVTKTQESAGQLTTFQIERNGESQTLQVTPEKEKPIGISLDPGFTVNPVRFAFPYSIVKATEEVGRQSYITLILAKDVVVSIFQKAAIPQGVAGPVGIAQMTGTFVKMGIIPLLIFIAMLSISLGVMNILPIPALDGGRFLFMVVELITRKKPNAKLETAIHAVGYVLLLLLILAVTGNDIVRIWQG